MTFKIKPTLGYVHWRKNMHPGICILLMFYTHSHIAFLLLNVTHIHPAYSPPSRLLPVSRPQAPSYLSWADSGSSICVMWKPLPGLFHSPVNSTSSTPGCAIACVHVCVWMNDGRVYAPFHYLFMSSTVILGIVPHHFTQPPGSLVSSQKKKILEIMTHSGWKFFSFYLLNMTEVI